MSAAIADAFDAKLRAHDGAKLTRDDLERRFPCALDPKPPSVASLDDVRFYETDFAASPDVLNAKYDQARKQAEQEHGLLYVMQIRCSNKHHELKKYRRLIEIGRIIIYRRTDFRLTDEEQRRLQDHRFMVTERLSAESFAEQYYRLYSDDMPVFITSDSVLHAWHRSFDAFLMDLEMRELIPLLNRILVRSLKQLEIEFEAASAASDGERAAVLADVEAYLAVAHRLLIGEQDEPAPPEVESPRTAQLRQLFGRDTSDTDAVGTPEPLCVAANTALVGTLLAAVYQEQSNKIPILGAQRDVDFSLFKPRGHYTKAANLERYFRPMTWLGTIDFGTDCMSYAQRDMTNNRAEYSGVLAGLREAKRRAWSVEVVGDSSLILGQLRRYRPPRHPALRPLYSEARRLADLLQVSVWQHHLRAYNKMADTAANVAMDRQASAQSDHPSAWQHAASIESHLQTDYEEWLKGRILRLARD